MWWTTGNILGCWTRHDAFLHRKKIYHDFSDNLIVLLGKTGLARGAQRGPQEEARPSYSMWNRTVSWFRAPTLEVDFLASRLVYFSSCLVTWKSYLISLCLSCFICVVGIMIISISELLSVVIISSFDNKHCIRVLILSLLERYWGSIYLRIESETVDPLSFELGQSGCLVEVGING